MGGLLRMVAGVVCAVLLVALVGCAASGGGRGASWTIQCLEAPGAVGAERLEEVATSLKRTPGIRPDDVFVQIGSDDMARLCYGSYRRPVDAKTGRRSNPADLRADLALIRELADDAGRRYFYMALPVRKPMPDVGDPAWRLGNVPAKYSLQVAAFEPTDDFGDFKEAAVAFCKLLRDRGYEAYYHHTEVGSLVTVGAFGADAVFAGVDGRTYYSAEVRKLQEEELLRYNLVNGSVHRVRSSEGELVPVPSRLVEIPRPPDGL